VQRLFQAVEDRDFDAMLECYDEDVEITETPSLPYGGVYRGHAGVRRHAEGFLRAWGVHQRAEGPRLEPVLVPGPGGVVVGLFRHRALDLRTGRVLDEPEVGVYEVVEGRVVRSRMYHFDPRALVEFLTEAPAPTDPSVGRPSPGRHVTPSSTGASTHRTGADDPH